MPTTVTMPQLGETVVEGTILKWLKSEGETIERDEPLFEISTDKVDTEVPSPVSGTVTTILVAEGETVPVGTELAEIDDGSSGGAGAGGVSAGATGPGVEAMVGVGAAGGPTPATSKAGSSAAVPPDRGPRSQILSPLVRKLAD